MTRLVLAAVLAGFLAFAPTTDPLRLERRKFLKGNKSPTDFGSSPAIPAVKRCVFILEHPFEPSYAYIRVDNAVHALAIHSRS